MGQSVAAEEERDNPLASSKVVLAIMFKRACGSSPPMAAGPSVPILAKERGFCCKRLMPNAVTR